ncbi:hypothetical protein JCM5350_000734 [Sporobolomyces pararoseus]
MSNASVPTGQTKSPGLCVVCGTQTSKLCSSCSKAGSQMFFCSIEHQRLVFFAHKLVCGNRSNPFLLPGFTQEETERFKYLAKLPLVPSPSGSIPFNDYKPLPDKPAIPANLVDNFVESEYQRSLDSRFNIGLVIYRMHAFDMERQLQLEHGSTYASNSLKLGRQQPANAFAFFLGHLPVKLFRVETLEEYASWSSRFQHLLLISLALSIQTQVQQDPELPGLANVALTRVVKFCREVVSQSHPKEASLLVDYFLTGTTDDEIKAPFLVV